MEEEKSKGQELYERDVARMPNYHNCKPRPSWDELSQTAQGAWERDWQLIQRAQDDDGA